MEKEKRQTLVNGQPTGDYTESGNNKHGPDGEFIGNEDIVNSEWMSEEEKAAHEKDRVYNVPHFEKVFLETLRDQLKVHGAECYSVYEENPYFDMDKKTRDYYDRQGIDYFIIHKGKFIAVDLKSIQPFNGGRANLIALPIDNYDYKVDNPQGEKGAYVNGWFTRKNKTQFLVFQRLAEEGFQDPDCFMLRKKKLQQVVYNNFFRNYGSNFEDSMKRLRADFRNAKTTALQNKGIIQDKSYSVKFDKDNRVSQINKIFRGEKGYMIRAFMKLKYEPDGKIRHSLTLQMQPELMMNHSQIIDPKQQTRNVLDIMMGLER